MACVVILGAGISGHTAALSLRRMLRLRSNIPFQLWRFAVINLRMLRMICKGH